MSRICYSHDGPLAAFPMSDSPGMFSDMSGLLIGECRYPLSALRLRGGEVVSAAFKAHPTDWQPPSPPPLTESMPRPREPHPPRQPDSHTPLDPFTAKPAISSVGKPRDRPRLRIEVKRPTDPPPLKIELRRSPGLPHSEIDTTVVPNQNSRFQYQPVSNPGPDSPFEFRPRSQRASKVEIEFAGPRGPRPWRQPVSFSPPDQHQSASDPDCGPILPFVFGDERPLPFVQPASSLRKRLSLPLCPFAPLPRAEPQYPLETGSGDGLLPIEPPGRMTGAPKLPPAMTLPFALLARKRVNA